MKPVQSQIEYVGLCIHNQLPNCTGYMKGFFTHASRGDRCDCGEGYLIQKHYRDCTCEQCGDFASEITNRWCLICNEYSRVSVPPESSPAPKEMTPSTAKLVKAMEESGCPEFLIERAKTEYYHDYKSPMMCPDIQLVAELIRCDQEALADRVNAGEFKASKKEASNWHQNEGRMLNTTKKIPTTYYESGL